MIRCAGVGELAVSESTGSAGYGLYFELPGDGARLAQDEVAILRDQLTEWLIDSGHEVAS